MSAPLPVIVGLPHGGLAAPGEMAGRIAITDTTIYNECDLWVHDLYDFAHPDLAAANGGRPGPGVLATVEVTVGRVFVDVNRQPDDAGFDGAIKTGTSYGDLVYQDGLTTGDRHLLQQCYWEPYHHALTAAFATHADQVRFFLDGHNMAQISPKAYAFKGAHRPFVCLANLGDERGEPSAHHNVVVSCSPAFLRRAGEIAADLFGDLALLEPVSGVKPPVVALNWPFSGGYILKRYTTSVPGIMVEINRGLFVGNQGTDTPIAPPNGNAIAAIRLRLFQWLTAILAEL